MCAVSELLSYSQIYHLLLQPYLSIFTLLSVLAVICEQLSCRSWASGWCWEVTVLAQRLGTAPQGTTRTLNISFFPFNSQPLKQTQNTYHFLHLFLFFVAQLYKTQFLATIQPCGSSILLRTLCRNNNTADICCQHLRKAGYCNWQVCCNTLLGARSGGWCTTLCHPGTLDREATTHICVNYW